LPHRLHHGPLVVVHYNFVGRFFVAEASSARE
jgi:hypothetical protein